MTDHSKSVTSRPVTGRDLRATREGIDSRENIRQSLIELRDALLGADEPRFEYVVLLSHAIWWLADDE